MYNEFVIFKLLFMRTKLVAANWKMNTTLADAHVLANGVRSGIEHLNHIEVVICPPAIWLTELAHHGIAPGQMTHLKLGAQNMHPVEHGAFTGEISPLMVKEVAEYVILGHSERVKNFRESADFINAKVREAIEVGLTPILCVGEIERHDSSIKHLVHLLDHLLHGVEDVEKVVIAYEPVWAISTNPGAVPATPAYAEEVMATLRSRLTPNTRILYGGSANAENALDFLQQADVDGVLVGGASLKLKDFLSICQQAEEVARIN